jgi:hypothetical protein
MKRHALIWMRPVLVAACLLAAPPAAGADSPLGLASSSGSRRFGLMLDAGVPDGANASLVLRPWRAVRFHAGGSYNLVSPGIRAGVSLIPLDFWISPTLTIDGGHYFEGNANETIQRLSGDTSFSNAMLDRVGYDYANARLGIELGRKWMTFYIHGGVSRILGTVHNIDSAIDSQTPVTVSNDVPVRIWTVSARLGLIVYFAR